MELRTEVLTAFSRGKTGRRTQMVYENVDHTIGQRGVIKRAAEEFSRRYSQFLHSTEDWSAYYDNDGLGVHVGIRSIRACQLLTSLEKSIFRGFHAGRFEFENGMVWARFGYSHF
jgi:hypothetical protein